VKVAEVDVADVPPGVMTEISTVEVLVLEGDTAVMEVDEFTVKLSAGLVPKSTWLTSSKFSPVMVTVVPPASGPALGETEVTTGTGKYSKVAEVEVAEVPPAVMT
jgi:hypothetical protein